MPSSCFSRGAKILSDQVSPVPVFLPSAGCFPGLLPGLFHTLPAPFSYLTSISVSGQAGTAPGRDRLIHQLDQFQQAPETLCLFFIQPGYLPLPCGVFLADHMHYKCLFLLHPCTPLSRNLLLYTP